MAGEKVDQNGERRCARRLAESALGSYGLRGARLLPIAHGWAQQTFRVEPPGRGAYVLNMYRLPRDGGTTDGPGFRAGLGLRSPQTLEAQLLWLGALGCETGLTVPDPVPALDGSLAGRVSLGDGQGKANGHSYALMGWVPGELMGGAPADLSSVGSFVARLHGHAERYRAPDPSALPRWDWHWPFGEAAHLWSRGEEFYAAEEMAVFEEAAQQAWADLEKLGYDAGAFGMIHRDLNFRNLVLSGGAVGAIDFDLCGLGHYMLDLTATLAAMGPLRAGGTLDQARESLLEGYERERDLPVDHRGYFATFIAMRRVAAVNRDLSLLASGAAGDRARGHRFLRNTVTWLRRNYLR